MMIRLILFICVALCSLTTMAQQYTLSELFATPYLSQLSTGGNTGNLVFAVNDRGHRNVYIARNPEYTPQNLTKWNEDLGLEITSLSVSADGQWAVFVRGGEHSGNWGRGESVNPASLIKRQQILLYTVHLPSGKVTLIGEGGYPEIHPDSKRVSFLKKDQVWIAPLDGSSEARQLFHVAGQVRSMQWSPDGTQLLFGSQRTASSWTYTFIGIFQEGKDRIRWVAPSYHNDRFPKWSPDGQSVAFVRTLPGDPTGIRVPWAIMVVDLKTNKEQEVWKASKAVRAHIPQGFDFQWPMRDAITFVSFQDGWLHLYKVNPHTGDTQQLTKGNFTIEQMSYSGDGSKVLLAANTGDRSDDIDRKHIGMVDIATGKFDLLTQGEGIETHPIFVRGTDEIAFFSNTINRPTLPTLMKINDPGSQKVVASSLLPNFDYQQLVTPEHVSFKSDDGHPVYGQLFKPKGTVKDAPAIVYIHGGPKRQMLLGWHFGEYYFQDYMTNQYLASQGYVVLSVNYRLGTGYGYDFQHAKNAGRRGASEYQDILASGKWLAKQSFVDGNRIGVYGGSYGGFLTAMALGKNSDIFKVGVDIHGVHNRIMGQTPSESNKVAWESSPSKWVDTWKSPVLIIHGDNDYNVGFAHSIDLVRRLANKNVEVEYLAIPDENHHWMLFENVMKVNEATVDFIKRKLPVK